ncbi:MAG: helix-turn-helix domain-containing protein [Pseudomonadales bacterium]
MNYQQSSLPTPEIVELAKLSSQQLSTLIETHNKTQKIDIQGKDGKLHAIELPVNSLHLLLEALTQLGEGNAVNLTPIHAELTTQEAADLLNISRPSLIKLLDEEKIPYHRVGNRRKVKFTDVSSYKDKIDDKRRKTLDELSDLDQELGLGYE